MQQVKSDERIWVRIGFDGVPYQIAKELIDKVYFCNGCEEITDLKEESLETHLLHFYDGESLLWRYSPSAWTRVHEEKFLTHHFQVYKGYFHV